MAQQINFKNHLRKLNELMQGGPVILYVGADCNIGNFPVLAGKPWSRIYTYRQDEGLPMQFHKDARQVRTVTSYEEIRRDPRALDKRNPMLIYLAGTKPLPADCDPDAEDDFDRNQEQLVQTIPAIMKNTFSTLLLVGYQADSEKDLSAKTLYSVLRNLGDRSVYFYGADERTLNNKYIKALIDREIAVAFTEDLGAELQAYAIEMDDHNFDEGANFAAFSPADQRYTFFANKRVCQAEKSLFYNFGGIGTLLTVGTLSYPPISNNMMSLYFYDFLKNSPSSPQWYGYMSRNGFSIRRDFESKLMKVVEADLERRRDSDDTKPIVLCGQTGSGKSIALANLAYQIFQQREYPVIYMTNPDLDFSPSTEACNALCALLENLEEQGAERVLVIWDCSVYNLHKRSSIQQLLLSCANRGRKVTVVASAMEQTKAEELRKSYHLIDAPILLTSNERKALKRLVIEKGKLHDVQVQKWMDSNQDDDNLLSLLYSLLYWIHTPLERGLRQEIRKGVDDINEEIGQIQLTDLPKRQLTAIEQAFAEKGIFSQRDEKRSEDLEAWREELQENLVFFWNCLAVSSQFKLHMPTTMAMRLLKASDRDYQRLCQEKIFNAPCLLHVEDNDEYNTGEFYVAFRTPAEARMFLNSSHIDEKAQGCIVARLIDMLGDETNPYFSNEISFLEQLIRLIGPNSDVSRVIDNSAAYRQGYPDIIKALQDLRIEEPRIVEPILVNQELTYVREYYGSNKQLPEVSIQRLEPEITFARELLEILRNRKSAEITATPGLINSITVESIFCEEYLQKAYALISPEKAGPSTIICSFNEQFNSLLEVINTEPRNSYAYTCLLRCFELCYQDGAVDNMTKLRYLSQILEIVEEVDASIPEVSCNSYYQSARQAFNKLFDQATGSHKVDEYFERLLELGSASGVHLRAHLMLNEAGIDLSKPLAPAARAACCDILALLETPSYAGIISRSSACQYMRLRLKWLYYNQYPIFYENREQQRTAMTREQWGQILNICCDFVENILQKNTSRIFYENTIYYLTALSYAQLEEYDQAISAFRSIEEANFNRKGRTWTWHILCDEHRQPKAVFSGVLHKQYYDDKKKSGKLYVDQINSLVYYRDLSVIGKAAPSGTVTDLCVGTSYIGFSVIAKNQLKRWDDHGIS